MKLKEMTKKNWKIILFGPVGVGKTGLALTLGEKAQVLDMDDGLITGQAMQDKFTKDRLEVDVKTAYEEKLDTAMAFPKAKGIITSVCNLCMKGDYKFDYFILDSLTALAEASLRSTMFLSGRLGTAPEIQHWGMAFMEIKDIMLMLRMLPITVVLIAHEQTREVDKQPVVEIAVQGKNLPSQIPRYFDEVWRMMIRNLAGGKKSYVRQTKGTAAVKVRSRGDLDDMIDTGIGMKGILAKLEEKLKMKGEANVKKGT